MHSINLEEVYKTFDKFNQTFDMEDLATSCILNWLWLYTYKTKTPVSPEELLRFNRERSQTLFRVANMQLYNPESYLCFFYLPKIKRLHWSFSNPNYYTCHLFDPVRLSQAVKTALSSFYGMTNLKRICSKEDLSYFLLMRDYPDIDRYLNSAITQAVEKLRYTIMLILKDPAKCTFEMYGQDPTQLYYDRQSIGGNTPDLR